MRVWGFSPSPELRSSPLVQFTSAFCICAFFAVLYLRNISFRDPGSWFFDYRTAYAHEYSTLRIDQAAEYVNNASTGAPFRRIARGDTPTFCVGIPSIARNGARYLRLTVGSLLEGLAQEERDRIHLAVLIAHTDPTIHPAYNDPWLANLVDEVLVYDLPQEQLQHIAELEKDRGLFREKGLFDHTYVLKACQATGAEYVVKVEDDILAMDGWFHRTTAGLREAERKSMASKGFGDFLYMRLFYTEEYLGYNSEDLWTHLLLSLSCIGGTAALLLHVRTRYPKTKRWLTSPVVAAASGFAVPVIILLIFAAGRVTLFPLPAGVNLMNNYGCCAQGQAFPRNKVPGLVEYLEAAHVGFIDTLTEAYADEHDDLRWALTPSVIQHIGEKSSKDGDKPDMWGFSASHKLWSFPFEQYDAAELHEEHQSAINSGTYVR